MGKRKDRLLEVKLSDFLTDKQIEAAWKIYEAHCSNVQQMVKSFADQIIRPNKRVIELKLDQEVDEYYLSYCLLVVFDVAAKQAREESGGVNGS